MTSSVLVSDEQLDTWEKSINQPAKPDLHFWLISSFQNDIDWLAKFKNVKNQLSSAGHSWLSHTTGWAFFIHFSIYRTQQE